MAASIASRCMEKNRCKSLDLIDHLPLYLSTINWMGAVISDHFLLFAAPPNVVSGLKFPARFREEPATVILFESPHRIAKLLASLLAGLGNRRAVLARELTKHYEEFHRGTLEELTALVRSHPLKGEVTLVVEGAATRRRSEPGEEAGQEPAREDE